MSPYEVFSQLATPCIACFAFPCVIPFRRFTRLRRLTFQGAGVTPDGAVRGRGAVAVRADFHGASFNSLRHGWATTSHLMRQASPDTASARRPAAVSLVSLLAQRNLTCRAVSIDMYFSPWSYLAMACQWRFADCIASASVRCGVPCALISPRHIAEWLLGGSGSGLW